MDVYLPALPELADDFGASPSAAQLTITTYVIGLSLGQLLGGTTSDVHGRRRPLVVGMAAAALSGMAAIHFMLGFLRRQSLDAFVVYRFVLAAIVLVVWLAR